MIALSTAYKQALIAVKIDGKSAFKSLDANCKHSENVLYSIDELLDSLNVSIQDNDALSVVIGPGSFTGIRIGVALVKGLSKGNPCKLIKLTTFDLLAYSYIKRYHPKDDFYCVIDALSGYYYICKFAKDGALLSGAQVVDSESYQAIRETKVGLKEENLGDIQFEPSPEELLELSEKYYSEGKFVSDSELIPLYLRKSQAEVSLENKVKKNI